MEWMEVVDVINGKTEDFKNCVYMWRNKVNGKLYIGVARKFKRRTKDHTYASFNKNHSDYNYPLHKSIRKRGIENYEICILEKNLSHDEMCDKEDFYIKKYDTLKKNEKGYNLASSGGSNNPLEGKTPKEKREISKKQSEARKGMQLSEKHKQNIGKAFKGEKNHQSRKVICITNGEIFNYIKQAEEKYGVDHRTISRCCKEKNKSAGVIDGKPAIWMYLEDYEKLSEEEIAKIKNQEVPNGGRPKAVICVTTGKIYESITEAGRQTGIERKNISKCCNEKRKSAGKDENGNKLEWKYLDEYLKSLK